MQETWSPEDVRRGKTREELKERVEQNVENITRFKGKEDTITPEHLNQLLLRIEEVHDDLDSLYNEPGLKRFADMDDEDAKKQLSQTKRLFAEVENKTMYLTHWFKNLEDEEAQRFIEHEALQNYAYYLEKTRKQRDHTRSEEVEKVINIKDLSLGNLSDIYQTLTTNYTYTVNGEEHTKEELSKYIQGSDPELRREAYKEMYKPFLEDKDVINDIYQTIATDWEKEATEIRGYTDSREMRTSGQDITPEAVDALLQAVTDNKDVFQEYFELKTGHLSEKQGIEANRHDIYAPLEELDADIPYEEAKQTVLNNLKDFDQRFYDAAKSVFDAGHVDSHPRKTKRSGAFCMSSPTGVAPYVMLNYDGTARDVSTMAHELGHAIHDVFVDEAQTPLNRHPTIPMAETASVFAEQVLFEQLLEQRPDDRLELLNQFLSDQFATILRQSYFTLFEERAHTKITEGARREELEEIYLELLQDQFGDLNIPEQFKDEWLLIPHIFRVPFYCYAYSWGNLLVLSLYDVYKEQGERFKDRYVELLRAGKSQSPQDIVSEFGFDLEDPAFWDRGFKLIRERLDEFKSLV